MTTSALSRDVRDESSKQVCPLPSYLSSYLPFLAFILSSSTYLPARLTPAYLPACLPICLPARKTGAASWKQLEAD